jgi:hypothetical protein
MMTPQEKRQQIDSVYVGMIALAQAGVEAQRGIEATTAAPDPYR